jgi:aspartate aminotransferase-like enzyme
MKRLLMHMGPCVSNEEVLRAGVVENIGFASPEFVQAMKIALEGLLSVTGAGEGYVPYLIPGSGTAAMEAMTSMLRRGDRVLILSNGVFGDRWKYIFERYPVHVDIFTAPPGRCIQPEDIEGIKQHYSMACITHVETSTGVRIDPNAMIEHLRELADRIVVDGVASVGGEEVSCSKCGADAVISASQKAIGSSPGLGLAVVREDAPLRDSVAPYYLNLLNWEQVSKNMLEGKSYYFATPPISAVFSLARAMDLIKKEGIERRYERHAKVADALRKGVEALGLRIVAEKPFRSNTVTAVYMDGNVDAFLAKCMDLGVEFASGVHPHIKGKYFRIGHMGWVTEEHARIALDTIETALSNKM